MRTPPPDTYDITALVADAAAAPSLHNAQPWKFRFRRDSGVLCLYAALERALPPTAPDNRGLHLGCGAALLNLRVAAAAGGRRPDVRLLPDPADPALLAEVDLGSPVPPDEALACLYPAIRRQASSSASSSTRSRCARTGRASSGAGLLSNPWLIGAGCFGVVLMAAISYAPPLQGVFHTAPLAPADWVVLAGFGELLLAAEEARKWVLRQRRTPPKGGTR
ncbi:cation transporting ATPase C-terminal domain-containing protein [Streptomyces sp. NPDC002671]